jgi:SWI/SNF-related matrix-associated actin-dependent regulator of chromatin subfamily A member 5
MNIIYSNWDREFQKWLPSCKLAILPGAREQREKVLSEQIITKKFNVVISSYEGF